MAQESKVSVKVMSCIWQTKASCLLDSSKVNCSIHVVDPNREGAPLVRRLCLNAFRISLRVGAQSGELKAVDDDLWDKVSH